MICKYGLAAMAVVFCASLFAPAPAKAQVFTWTKDQMVDYTKLWTGDRFPDGRPKVPDSWLERAKDMSQEEVTGISFVPNAGRGGGFGGGGYGQYEGDFHILHPDMKMAGRAVTVAFLPARPDLDSVVQAHAKDKNITVNNQYVLDQLQPGDVLVVDLYGKKDGGTIVGDNLFYYVMKATKAGGLVVDGAIRDLEGIQSIPMPAYFRSANPTALTTQTAMLAAYNVPVRIGNVTVMPGDLVMGDKEGVSFIPPQAAKQVLDAADTTHVHDEWTKKKFDEGKYKSTDIYSSPREQTLRDEYNEYLKKRLEEIRKSRGDQQ